MTTPAELRALADTIEENRIIPERAPHVALLRSAAARMDELIQSNEELEKALEQAKREENEACARIIESRRFIHELDTELYHNSSGGRMCARCGEPAYEEGQPCSSDETNERINAIVAAIRSRLTTKLYGQSPIPAQAHKGEKDETK